MSAVRTDVDAVPTFLYRGRRFLWGYTPDRQVCGMWHVADPSGPPHRSWPISEHEAAWGVFRSTEPRAVAYTEPVSVPEPVFVEPADSFPHASPVFLSPSPATARPSPVFVESSQVPSVTSGAAGDVASLAEEEASLPAPADWDTVRESDAAEPAAPDQKPARNIRSVPPAIRRRQLALLVALAVVLVVGVVFGVSKLRSSSSPPAVVSPSSAVLASATTTESAHTARMSLNVTVSGVPGSGTVSVPASGVVDFTQSACSMTMTIDGQSVSIVTSGGTIYESVPTISQLLPGKSWLAVPYSSSGSTSGGVFSAGNPAQMLELLSAQGNTVSALGPSTVDGVSVEGYAVVVNKTAVESELGRLGLPVQAAQAADEFLQQVGSITYKVYIDSANQLRAMDFSMGVPDGTHTLAVSADVVLDDFGAPVSVSVPPASQVATVQQFLQAAQSSPTGL